MTDIKDKPITPKELIQFFRSFKTNAQFETQFQRRVISTAVMREVFRKVFS